MQTLILKTEEIQQEVAVYDKLKYLILILLFASFQNEAYKGGTGDGFAQVELIRFTTSVKQNVSEINKVSVFPNPVMKGETINIKNSNSAEYTLINTSGNEVFLGYNISHFSTTDFAKGSYILQVNSGEDFQFIKVMIL